jgi:uncharacterized protein YbjT (DUF2867 family)
VNSLHSIKNSQTVSQREKQKSITMNNKPIILVTGATGAQGGSVARALLAAGKFTVRILTRDPHSESARALENAGARVAKGNFNDIKSLEKAMKGCYGVFGVTNFWEHYEHEFQHGKNLADAVKTSGVKHFVLHTLADYHKLSGGLYKVPHCDIKAALQNYCRDLHLPASFVQLAFYYENFFNFFPLQQMEDGSYSFGFPQGDTKLAMASVEDLGPVVAAIFDHPKEYIGRTVGVVGSDATCAEYAAQMSEVLGKVVRFQYIPREVYAEFGFPGAVELANMFEVQRLYIPERQFNLIESYGLNPRMQNFRTWLKNHRSKFLQLLSTSGEIAIAV